MITLRLTDSQDSPTNRVCQDFDQSGYVIHKAPVRYYHDDLNAIPTVMWCQFCHQAFVDVAPDGARLRLRL